MLQKSWQDGEFVVHKTYTISFSLLSIPPTHNHWFDLLGIWTRVETVGPRCTCWRSSHSCLWSRRSMSGLSLRAPVFSPCRSMSTSVEEAIQMTRAPISGSHQISRFLGVYSLSDNLEWTKGKKELQISQWNQVFTRLDPWMDARRSFTLEFKEDEEEWKMSKVDNGRLDRIASADLLIDVENFGLKHEKFPPNADGRPKYRRCKRWI